MMQPNLTRQLATLLLPVLSCAVLACSPTVAPMENGISVAGGVAPAVAGAAALPVAGSVSVGAAGSLVPAAGSLANVGAAGVVGVAGSVGGGAAGVVAAAVGGTAGAGASAAGAAGSADPVPGSPTFSAIFQDIIVGTGCNGGAACHAGMAGGNLTMRKQADTYSALVNMKGMGMTATSPATKCMDSGLVRVVPNDPDKSLLYQKLSAAMAPCGQSMPPGGALNPAQIMQVRTWIMNGAKND
jgi:hypothetical protein